MSDKKHGRHGRKPCGKTQTARTNINKQKRAKKHDAFLAECKTKKEAKNDER